MVVVRSSSGAPARFSRVTNIWLVSMPIEASAACTTALSRAHAAHETTTAATANVPTAHRNVNRIASLLRNVPAVTTLTKPGDRGRFSRKRRPETRGHRGAAFGADSDGRTIC